MVDIIVSMLNTISSAASGGVGNVLLTPAEYQPAMYNAAVLIHNTAVKPVTSIVLAIIASMMLATNSTKIESDRELGIKIVAASMFKVAMVLMVCQSAIVILDGIAGVAQWIATTANNVSIGGSGETIKLGDQMRKDIEDAGTMNQAGMVMVLLIPYVVSAFGTVVATVLVFMRFLQMYIMNSFASLPIAFLSHEDTKQIGIGYLKRYGVVAITGAVLVLAVKLYQALMSGWIAREINYDGDALGFVAGNFGTFIIAPLVLIFLLFQANSLAKSVLGEG